MWTSSASKREGAEATPDDQVLVAPLRPGQLLTRSRETLVADVVIQNKGIRPLLHPRTAATFTRPGWTSQSRTAAGKTLAESGFIKPDGNLDPSAHSFTSPPY